MATLPCYCWWLNNRKELSLIFGSLEAKRSKCRHGQEREEKKTARMGGYFQGCCDHGQVQGTFRQHRDDVTLEPRHRLLAVRLGQGRFWRSCGGWPVSSVPWAQGREPSWAREPFRADSAPVTRPPAYSPRGGRERNTRPWVSFSVWPQPCLTWLKRGGDFRMEFGFLMYMAKLSMSWFANVKYGNTIHLNFK